MRTLVDLTEHHNTRKFGFGVVRNGRMEDEDPCNHRISTLLPFSTPQWVPLRISPPASVGTSLCDSRISIVGGGVCCEERVVEDMRLPARNGSSAWEESGVEG